MHVLFLVARSLLVKPLAFAGASHPCTIVPITAIIIKVAPPTPRPSFSICIFFTFSPPRYRSSLRGGKG